VRPCEGAAVVTYRLFVCFAVAGAHGQRLRPVAGGVYGVPVPAAARAITALGLGICGLRFLMIPSQACSKQHYRYLRVSSHCHIIDIIASCISIKIGPEYVLTIINIKVKHNPVPCSSQYCIIYACYGHQLSFMHRDRNIACRTGSSTPRPPAGCACMRRFVGGHPSGSR
jgi:hypothetical protein